MTKFFDYKSTGFYTKLILDYLEEKDNLKSFYNNSFSIKGFEKQLTQKQFSNTNRKTLNQLLLNQYSSLSITSQLESNINLLLKEHTYTVTTGHQLNLLTGPLYFFYKIISTINLANELKNNFPDKNFVPVFWMATEDHDFEEINHFNLFDKKHVINSNQTGAVGRMNLEGIDAVFNQLEETLKGRTGLEKIVAQLKAAYREENTFTQAIREFVNQLFGKYGLVIIDGDDSQLKRLFTNDIKKELLTQSNAPLVNKTSNLLTDKGYHKQVNPREINLFYLKGNIRERIVLENNNYKVLNTDIEFSQTEILNELDNHPERFSPNVVLRPLYQEVVLPNLAYIGGGGELAYWLQLKQMFDANNITFPILGLRNSVLIVDPASARKIGKLKLGVSQFFKPVDTIIKNYIKEGADIILDLKAEEKCIEEVFEDIVEKAGKIDVALQPMIKAELQKSLKSIKNIETRLIKAEKQKEDVAVNQIKSIHKKLFPSNSLQERQENFLYAYLLFGERFIDILLDNLNPFKTQMVILKA